MYGFAAFIVTWSRVILGFVVIFSVFYSVYISYLSAYFQFCFSLMGNIRRWCQLFCPSNFQLAAYRDSTFNLFHAKHLQLSFTTSQVLIKER